MKCDAAAGEPLNRFALQTLGQFAVAHQPA